MESGQACSKGRPSDNMAFQSSEFPKTVGLSKLTEVAQFFNRSGVKGILEDKGLETICMVYGPNLPFGVLVERLHYLIKKGPGNEGKVSKVCEPDKITKLL